MKRIFILIIFLTLLSIQKKAESQNFTLAQCIQYALEHNISVQQSKLSAETNKVNAEQIRSSRFPSVDANIRQNHVWIDEQQAQSDNWKFTGNSSTSAGINANVTLFNGFRTNNAIKQAESNYQAGLLDAETRKESVILQVLQAYMQVLYADEQIKNAKNQVDLTAKQLEYAKERYKIGAISQADYLQIESQLATEKLTLTNANNQLASNKTNLMQLMEHPITQSFSVEKPDLSQLKYNDSIPDVMQVYALALASKPQVQSIALKSKSAELEISKAQANKLPTLSLEAGITTNYSGKVSQLSFSSQLDHNFSPSIGVTLSIPIFKQGSIKSQIQNAQIQQQITQLDGQSTLNQLRKDVENACLDVTSSITEYKSAFAQQQTASESYELAQERFSKGVINSVDFLYQKTSFIKAESTLLQARYNLLYSLKVLDFYSGKEVK